MRLLLPAVLGLLTVLDAQAKPTAPNKLGAYLPFGPGAEWTWDLTVDDGKPSTRTWRCVRQVAAGKDGQRAWELRVDRGEARSWTYWSVGDQGLCRHANRYLGGGRGVSSKPPSRLVPGPLGATTKWQWTELGTVQTEGGEDYPSPEELRMHFEGRIVAMTETVTVPAGTFQAVRIQVTMSSPMFGETEETLWLARGTGIVKQRIVDKTQPSTQVYALRRYTAGADPRQTPQQRIHELLARPPAEAAPPALAPVRHDALDEHLGSEFFVARRAGEVLMFRDFEGRASRFDPLRIEAWNRLIREEFGEARHRELANLAEPFGVLAALAADPAAAPKTHGAATLATHGGQGNVRARITVRDPAGRRVGRWARVWFAFKPARVTRIEFR
jgi:hypothetical protein